MEREELRVPCWWKMTVFGNKLRQALELHDPYGRNVPSVVIYQKYKAV